MPVLVLICGFCNWFMLHFAACSLRQGFKFNVYYLKRHLPGNTSQVYETMWYIILGKKLQSSNNINSTQGNLHPSVTVLCKLWVIHACILFSFLSISFYIFPQCAFMGIIFTSKSWNKKIGYPAHLIVKDHFYLLTSFYHWKMTSMYFFLSTKSPLNCTLESRG